MVADGVLGHRAATQVPDAGARRRLLRKYLRKHVGPSGERAKKGLRAWRKLQEVAARRLLPDFGLPASAALVADCVAEELQRALGEARDGQDGHSVGGTFRDGFMFLERVAKLRVAASGPLVVAAAEPPAELPVRAVRHAGTMPIAVQCAFEEVAAEPAWSVRRTLARGFLVTVFAHHIRLCDALNARLWPDELEPGRVIRGSTVVRSKKSLPLQLYAPAAGFLGEWLWYPEHLAEMSGRAHSLPAFGGGRAGRPSEATRLEPGVLSDAHALKAFRDVLEHSAFVFPEAPAAFYQRWGLRGHSPHSTGSDMARFIGWRGGFSETDARELGHWLRDREAPQPDPRRVPGAPRRGQPDGAPCARGAMSLRYSQGQGRRGEREAQLDVRARLLDAVALGLEGWGASWRALPAGNADWDILRCARLSACDAAAEP